LSARLAFANVRSAATRAEHAATVGLGVAVLAALTWALVWFGAITAPAPPVDWSKIEERTLLERKSEYTPVYVSEIVNTAEKGLRVLRFEPGGQWQSAARLDDPGHLAIAYTQLFAVAFAFTPEPKRALMVGMGGGTFPRFLRARFPDLAIDVVDIDPVVVEVAKSHFGFREDERLRAYVDDGRRFVETRGRDYDTVFLDAYGSDSIPFHLATREFMQSVRKTLVPGGVVVSNVWGPRSNKLYDSMLSTYREVFTEVSVVPVPDSGNHMVIAHAAKTGLSRSDVRERALALGRGLKLPPEFARAVAMGYRPIASDAPRAPVLEDANRPR
jgi:spermidine synthase